MYNPQPYVDPPYPHQLGRKGCHTHHIMHNNGIDKLNIDALPY